MKQSDRKIIFNKFGGKCAYCGCELEKGWHVDELEPCKRKYKYQQGYWINRVTGTKIVSLGLMPDGEKSSQYNHVKARNVPDGCEYPERLVISNQMPACASCNINKHSMSLEEFRMLIEGFMKHLNELNTQYKIAKRYGLVKEQIKPIVFYFELPPSEKEEPKEQASEQKDATDLKQYITNLLYNAYNDGKQKLSSDVFNKWVEAEWDNIDSFYASQHKVEMPTEEEIEREFPTDRETILKNEYSSDLFSVQRNNYLSKQGARWVIEWINSKNK